MIRRAAEAAAFAVLGHPRHAALFALVGGLLLARAPVWSAAVLAGGLAALALVSGRALGVPGAGVALACAVAALAGGAIGKERLRVVDSGRLAAVAGTSISEPVVLLEPLRRRGAGPSVARVRLAGGPLRGEGAVLRVRGDALSGGAPGTGEILEVEGSVAPLGFFDAYQRPRGAGAAIDARAVRRTGRRRGGLAGALDARAPPGRARARARPARGGRGAAARDGARAGRAARRTPSATSSRSPGSRTCWRSAART